MSLGTFTGCGRVIADPALRYTSAGKAVLSFPVAFSHSVRDETTGTWTTLREEIVRVTVWERAAENAAESLTRGCAVIVSGARYVREYEKDGQRRQSLELTADALGLSLRHHPATIRKPEAA